MKSNEVREAIGRIVDFCQIWDQLGKPRIMGFAGTELNTDDLYTLLSSIEPVKGVSYQYGLVSYGTTYPITDDHAQQILGGRMKLGMSETLVRRPIGDWEEVDGTRSEE